jgi:hypothetical protein
MRSTHQNSPETSNGLLATQRTARRIDGYSDVLFSAVIKVREGRAQVRTESVHVVSASAGGVGFYSEQKCVVGQIVSLMMEMPRDLRRYDQDKKFYKVWALVQHCETLTRSSFVGVAFIGSVPPDSYLVNPTASFRIAGVGSNGFWTVKETEHPYQQRSHTRFRSSIDVRLVFVNSDGNEEDSETALTDNISETGTAVFSNARREVGELVRISTGAYGFEATAIIRNTRADENGRPRLHLEFIDTTFPVSRLSE